MSDLPMSDLPTDKYGTVHTLDDGRRCVHFERTLPYPADRVWHALIDADALAQWFPGLSLEPRLGGKFEIWFSGECDGPAHVTGEVTVFNPPFELQLGSMRWLLSPVDAGCRLVFTDILHFDDRDPIDFMVSVLGGWHKYVDSLERHMQGGSGDPREDQEVDYRKIIAP